MSPAPKQPPSQRDRIGLNAARRGRDILKGGHDRAAILGGGLFVGGLRGEFAVQKGRAVEDGLRDAAGNDPKFAAGHKQLVEGKRITAGIPGERYIGQPVRNGDADLGAGGL